MRVGALAFGVSTIIGGNAFDALQISLADATCTEGTIHQAAGPSSLVLLGGTVLVAAVLAAGRGSFRRAITRRPGRSGPRKERSP